MAGYRRPMFTKMRSLVGKLALIQTGFLLVALAAIGLTLWVSWQLEGGAGAINEAGRMRMMSYRMALAHGELQRGGTQSAALAEDMLSFDAMVLRLRDGDPQRPLFVPDTEDCRDRLDAVQRLWPRLRGALARPDTDAAALKAEADAFVARVDELVGAIERTIAMRTALLGGMCFGLVVLVVFASVIFVSGTYVWVLQPLQRLGEGLRDMARRDFSVRVDEQQPVEEFSTLAEGFNQMADTLQSLYAGLEHKVAEKTADLARQNERLAALYDVTLMATQNVDHLEALGSDFAAKVARIAQADAAAVRLIAQDQDRVLLLGSARLPAALREAERCVHLGDCACSAVANSNAEGARVIPIRSLGRSTLGHCEAAGYQSLVTVPMRSATRVIGEVELFYYGERQLSEDERQLLEALAGHFGALVENVRLAASDRELAVSEERNLLAQELHDSIAQSLAFLKIQVQLLRGAMAEHKPEGVARALEEIDTGVRECYADVRELLLHFRTRTGHEDIEHALRSTLSKFEHQTGISTTLDLHGHGVPLPADQQVQVLHVLQEALSNARKHALARHVVLTVHKSPHWRFEVQDDGQGFDMGDQAQHDDGTHVGLRIMRERAQRIGAQLDVSSLPGRGTRVVLSVPAPPHDASSQHPSPREEAQAAT